MPKSNDTESPLRKGFVLLLLIGITVGFLGMIRDFLIALILAAIVAGLLYPLYSRVLAFFRGRSMLASGATMALTGLALGLPLAGLASIVVVDALQVSQQVGPTVQKALASDVPISERLPDWFPFSDWIEPYREVIQNKLADAAASLGSWTVKSVAGATQDALRFFLGLFVFVYAMFFFLINGPEYLRRLKSLLPLSAEDRDLVMERGVSITRASLKGIVVIGAVQGLLVGLAFWVSGLGAPAFWGAVVFVLSAIPGVGAPLVWFPAAVYLMATGSLAWGIGLALWGLVVVGLVDNLLRPMVVGRDAKLPDLLILVAIFGGIATFGAAGILVGPIVAAVLDTVMNIYRKAFADSLPS